MKTTHRTDCFRIILALAAFALTAVPSHAQETLTDADVAALRAELDGRADEDERQLLFAQGLDELNNERFEKAEHFVREAIKKGLQNQHSYDRPPVLGPPGVLGWNEGRVIMAADSTRMGHHTRRSRVGSRK